MLADVKGMPPPQDQVIIPPTSLIQAMADANEQAGNKNYVHFQHIHCIQIMNW